MTDARRIYRLDLTRAELIVLDRLTRDLELYSPARRGLHAKIGNKAAQDRSEQGNFTPEEPALLRDGVYG